MKRAIILAMALSMPAQAQTTDCKPVAQLYNELGRCYSKHGGDFLPWGGQASIWVRRNNAPGCERARRLIVETRPDKTACIWWRSEES